MLGAIETDAFPFDNSQIKRQMEEWRKKNPDRDFDRELWRETAFLIMHLNLCTIKVRA